MLPIAVRDCVRVLEALDDDLRDIVRDAKPELDTFGEAVAVREGEGVVAGDLDRRALTDGRRYVADNVVEGSGVPVQDGEASRDATGTGVTDARRVTDADFVRVRVKSNAITSPHTYKIDRVFDLLSPKRLTAMKERAYAA